MAGIPLDAKPEAYVEPLLTGGVEVVEIRDRFKWDARTCRLIQAIVDHARVECLDARRNRLHIEGLLRGECTRREKVGDGSVRAVIGGFTPGSDG